ncbi:molybdopterin molybdotransferase MoeA [Methanosphaerula palustris]|uniref:Molybdenum cofactor synthesis domain protein n=1 Tax=Methanosphaerula palustris (strain ATCC BAA-1556 / DSM 19958 / E1-9c) TaxID=521011 RepID=B8GIX5_METPE|nr:gephyrin-like molybdotransferase Glp [Methanosphaerula palustris]ACL15548.1 molybdenum cofactor synthesis domain protein [Methanosphaerula palustris E1-9c]
MPKFLQVVSVQEAVQTITSIARPVSTETIPLEEAGGRVLAEDVTADLDIPGFTRSVMDGYAVIAAETSGAGEALPTILRCTGRVLMGEGTTAPIRRGECVYVPTGGMIPPGADAMVMIEYTEELGDQVLVQKPVAPGENLILQGEDFKAGEQVLPGGTRLSPQDVGALAAVGRTRVEVYRRPLIGIISTGNEVVPVGTTPSGSQVRDVNSYLCRTVAESCGCRTRSYGIVRDEEEALAEVLNRAAVETDGVLISGGSSKDARDHGATVIARAGSVLVHGVALAPGKPTIIGKAGAVPVIGLPGHPASAYVVLMVLGIHLFGGLTGGGPRPSRVETAVLNVNIPSTRGREDYIRVSLDRDDGKKTVATPLFGKSGLLNTLVRSDGLIRIPAGAEGMEAGTPVEVLLW